MCLVFFIPYLCIGIPLLGFFETDISLVALFFLAVFALTAAFTSIFTLIAMLNQNKAVVAILCILIAFVLYMMGPLFSSSAQSRPPSAAHPIAANDETASAQIALGQTVHFIYDFTPGGQAIQCTAMEADYLPVLPVYSMIIVLITTGAGLFFFRKKDLK